MPTQEFIKVTNFLNNWNHYSPNNPDTPDPLAFEEARYLKNSAFGWIKGAVAKSNYDSRIDRYIFSFDSTYAPSQSRMYFPAFGRDINTGDDFSVLVGVTSTGILYIQGEVPSGTVDLVLLFDCKWLNN